MMDDNALIDALKRRNRVDGEIVRVNQKQRFVRINGLPVPYVEAYDLANGVGSYQLDLAGAVREEREAWERLLVRMPEDATKKMQVMHMAELAGLEESIILRGNAGDSEWIALQESIQARSRL